MHQKNHSVKGVQVLFEMSAKKRSAPNTAVKISARISVT
jgi:hypothetical protein